MTDNPLEEEIYQLLEEVGFGSKLLTKLKENAKYLSAAFITDILAENINLYIDYAVLLDFLSIIWQEDNDSPNLLAYISAIAHHTFYLAKDYPLGKEVPEYLAKKIDQTYEALKVFQRDKVEIKAVRALEPDSISSFAELVRWLENFPRYPFKIKECIDILACFFKQYITSYPQHFTDEDSLALFCSRCLIFWKMGALSSEELTLCLEKMINKADPTINIRDFKRILSLEMLNYQFLQLGFTQEMIDVVSSFIVKSFKAMQSGVSSN